MRTLLRSRLNISLLFESLKIRQSCSWKTSVDGFEGLKLWKAWLVFFYFAWQPTKFSNVFIFSTFSPVKKLPKVPRLSFLIYSFMEGRESLFQCELTCKQKIINLQFLAPRFLIDNNLFPSFYEGNVKNKVSLICFARFLLSTNSFGRLSTSSLLCFTRSCVSLLARHSTVSESSKISMGKKTLAFLLYRTKILPN